MKLEMIQWGEDLLWWINLTCDCGHREQYGTIDLEESRIIQCDGCGQKYLCYRPTWVIKEIEKQDNDHQEISNKLRFGPVIAGLSAGHPPFDLIDERKHK